MENEIIPPCNEEKIFLPLWDFEKFFHKVKLSPPGSTTCLLMYEYHHVFFQKEGNEIKTRELHT